jgi:hypothetical protein
LHFLIEDYFFLFSIRQEMQSLPMGNGLPAARLFAARIRPSSVRNRLRPRDTPSASLLRVERLLAGF